MKVKIAFATSDEFPHLTEDDLLAVKALEKHDIRVKAAIWSDPAVDWTSFSAVVIRSCWDYHRMPNDFKSWLDRLEQSNVNLYNPYEIVRWNMTKTYLNDLQKRGVPVLDSVWLTDGVGKNLNSIMLEKGWDQVVVKPVISAAAKDTENIRLENASDYQHEFEALLNRGGVIVQDFAEEIKAVGEWSLTFFNKEYSHSVIKKPQEGDFRVQFDFGGKTHSAEAPDHLVQQAQEIVNSIQGELLYARVDGIERSNILILMELELIEPHLFFELNAQAPTRFANALLHFLTEKDQK